MELRSLDELKSKVASIVLSSNNPDSHSQNGGVLALTIDSTSQNGHAHAVAAGNKDLEQPSWLHSSDPSSLQLHEQDALIYNKYVAMLHYRLAVLIPVSPY